jgi:signal transduction histidine kinase
MGNEEDQINLIRRIASVVGHELRNPLAVINNSAYFLKTKLGQDGRLDPKVDKHLGIVVSEIARTDKMISDILTYSRKVEPKLQKLPVNPVVEAALAALAVPDKVKVKKELSKDKPEGEIDEALFNDCLRRLLDNAVESMLDGGTLTVSTSSSKKEVRVEVRDTGAGVKAEILPHLFEPFRTTKPKGLGLGLAMTRKLMEAQKGRAEGKNASPGAVFALVLPGI